MHQLTAFAPGRVNLIGEHLDYNGGLCLPIALPQSTSATVRRRNDGQLQVRSEGRRWFAPVDSLRPGSVTGWATYVAGVVWALGIEDGLDIELSSDVPVSAGLSSSAAVECSVALAVEALLGLGQSRAELISACIRAETEMVGAPTGGLDQMASMLAEEGHALLIDFATDVCTQVPFRPQEAGLALLVIDTRVSHDFTDGGYGGRRSDSEEAARLLGVPHLALAGDLSELTDPRLLRRAKHVLSEQHRVETFESALRAGDWDALGPLMVASHESMRDDYEISCEELDTAVSTAVEHGALGARMTGGGFGGSAIALVNAERLDEISAAVLVEFGSRGWTTPNLFTALASPGAHLLSP
ncbi:MAG: galactokinase [Actinomycetota bacterium]|nr:galactokinase [Actinomycetota bacterium]